jgi:hypothetical protein
MSRSVSNLIALAVLSLLSGCIVQTRAYAPPPPRVYVAAPVVSAEVAAPEVDVSITASEPPPPLPDYEQPPCPDDGYLWTPGYWHYGYAGYYWVPGTWVQPPQVGVLWTPGYWAFSGGVYGFHAGYWGPHIGYYGGVNYGFGYVGVGFVGGRWEGGHYAYNTAVNNVRTTNIHNTYNETVVNNVTVNRVSYNGGAGGVTAVPTPQDRVAAHEAHIAPTAAQTSHIQEAGRNPALFAKANGDHPAIAATARPGAFTGAGVVGAHGAAGPAVANVPGNNGMGAKANVPAANLSHAQTPHATPGVKPKTQLAKVPPPKPKAKAAANKNQEPEGDRPR